MTEQDHEIDQHLRALALAVEVPAVVPHDDLARGRERLRRRRVVVAAAALVTAGVVGGSTLLLGGGGPATGDGLVATSPTATDPVSTATDPAPTEPTAPSPSESSTEPPVGTAAPDPRDAKQLLTDWRDVIASYLDPRDEHLDRTPTNLQGGGGLGTKLGWDNAGEAGLGMVQVFVSRSWGDQFFALCGRGQECRDLRVDGIRARVLDDGTDTYVGVRHPGFVVVISVNALFGNNSTVPVSGLDVSVEDLARVAADDRFSLPTRQQVDGASKAFGFPDF